MAAANVMLRPAKGSDARDIARIMRAARSAFNWMPVLHTPDEDLAFVGEIVLPRQRVIVADAGGKPVGFAAGRGEWVEHLCLDPAWTGRGIGGRLLAEATRNLKTVRLHCFQANAGARRFYERHGFSAMEFGDGSGNEEGLPDIVYVRER